MGWLPFLFGSKDDSNSRYLVIELEMSYKPQRMSVMRPNESSLSKGVGLAGSLAL